MSGRVDTTAAADIRFFCGSTGSGKSYQIKQGVRDAGRLLVWDPDDEYASDVPGVRRYRSVKAAAIQARKAGLGKFRAAVTSTGLDEFGRFCRLAFALADARAPLTVAVDELADVDAPAKAPRDWGLLIRRVRKYRGRIFAGAQSPAEISKTLLKQRTYLWIGYLESPHDHAYLADKVNIPRAELEQLRPRPYFDAIEKRAGDTWRRLPPAK